LENKTPPGLIMKFIADFHVHSKFSRATSKNLDLENLHVAAQLKGITVIGTGDFTHPEWFSEIKAKLVPAEEGLFKLNDDIAAICDQSVPAACRSKVRYVLSAEISNIYKQEGKTRKNHNLIVVPDMETAARFSSRLDAIGNIRSDGRPILGLNARQLLEILLDADERSFLIPAHIWTPWFSVLGSKSGFDSIEECYGDLSRYIFAVETGLSSDPAMNWRISGLDRYTLISNSDAHSPRNLGREANLFDTDLSYGNIFAALKSRNEGGFLGTFEFYPEEGKYHLDGHRKCNVRFSPQESIRNKGICPRCGKALTLGVLYRVEELADRPVNAPPPDRPPFYSSIPLTDILAEILRVGPGSRKVQQQYERLLTQFGPEFHILHSLSVQRLQQEAIPLLAEALQRVRSGNVCISPGYDGELGKIRIFDYAEMESCAGQKPLFDLPELDRGSPNTAQSDCAQKEADAGPVLTTPPEKRNGVQNGYRADLNRRQQEAVQIMDRALLIVAGPGTGKTLTLTRRIAYLIGQRNVPVENILAVTFTNKAAREMQTRIAAMPAVGGRLPLITTFHGLCYRILKNVVKNRSGADGDAAPGIIDETERIAFFNEAAKRVKSRFGNMPANSAGILDRILSAKQMLLEPQDDLRAVADWLDIEILTAVYREYQQLLADQRLYDFEDLILQVVKTLQTDAALRGEYQEKFKFIFVDEFQDVNQGQHRLLQLLLHSEASICAIGDPDQSIYGFRGSDIRYFEQFVDTFSDTKIIRLTRNYRSTRTIVAAAGQVLQRPATRSGAAAPAPVPDKLGRRLNFSNIEGFGTVTILETSSERSEAVAVGKTIEKMIGGTGFQFIDFDKGEAAAAESNRSFSDFAVLYRTGAQSKIFAEIFTAAGIPYQIVSREHAYALKTMAQIYSLLRILAGVGSFADLEKTRSIVSATVSAAVLDHFIKDSLENRLSVREALREPGCSGVLRMAAPERPQLHRFLDSLRKMQLETRGMRVLETLGYVLEKTGQGRKLRNKENVALRSIEDLAETFGKRLADFVAALTLQTDTDLHLPQAERVALMTMHAAKGLEFPVVFVCGCEDGYIPLRHSEKKVETDVEEERRLFYVAMTRARERLFLTHAAKRRIYGKTEKREPSPFVSQIEAGLKQIDAEDLKKVKNQRQLELF